MKKLLQIILVIFFVWLMVGWLKVYNELIVTGDVILTGLPDDWLYPTLSIDGSGKVYKNDLLNLSFYISGTTDVTTTVINTYYPMSWEFVTDVTHGFTRSWDTVVYTGKDTTIKILYSTAVESDTINTVISMWVRKNWVILEWCIGRTKLESTTAIHTVSSVCTTTTTSGDVYTFTVSSDKAGAVITLDNYSLIAERF